MEHLARCVNTAAAPRSLRRNIFGVILNGKSTQRGPGPVPGVRTGVRILAPDGVSAPDPEARDVAVWFYGINSR
jgi:hypothetical protein